MMFRIQCQRDGLFSRIKGSNNLQATWIVCSWKTWVVLHGPQCGASSAHFYYICAKDKNILVKLKICDVLLESKQNILSSALQPCYSKGSSACEGHHNLQPWSH